MCVFYLFLSRQPPYTRPELSTPQHQPTDHDADLSSEDNEATYEGTCHSYDGILEVLCENEAQDYPFSPPSNSRIARRSRSRRNSGKKSQPRVVMAAEKCKKPVVIKERYVESNALISGLAHVDSDADLERDNSRESKDKRKKDREDKLKSKTRQHEIYVKRHSDDASGFCEGISSPMGISTPVVSVNVETSGRFPSFSLSQQKILPVSPFHPDRVERRPTVTLHTDCPKERLTFYKTFQALINMGSHGKKNKEERIFTQRQKSSDEQLYMNCVWIGLQAWLNGLEPPEQENLMSLERESIPFVISSIMDFKVQFQFIGVSDQLGLSTDSDKAKNRDSSCSIDTCMTDVSMTYHSMALTSDMIEQQQEAVKQVQKVLEKIDRCEQLFPTSHAFALEYPKYKETDFVRRIEALYLWLNTTTDLCHKLNVLGQVFNISPSIGCSWPFMDFISSVDGSVIDKALHRTSIPEIEVDDEDGEGDYEDDEEYDECDGVTDPAIPRVTVQNGEPKKVSFACYNRVPSPGSPITSPKRVRSPSTFGSPPDASTPFRASSSSLSRASSEASLDDLARSSVYRTYVEKGLKKMGLNKMLIRLRDILYRSLRRARQSLEQPHLDAESMMVGICFTFIDYFCKMDIFTGCFYVNQCTGTLYKL